MAITKPPVLDDTGKEVVEVLKMINGTLAKGSPEPEKMTWRQIQAVVRTGNADVQFPVGTQFAVYKYNNGATKTGTPVKYILDVVAHNVHFNYDVAGNKTAEYSMTLQFHNEIEAGMPFDAAEDQYGLSLDTAVVDWKTYYSDAEGTVVPSPTGSPKDNGYYEKNDANEHRKQYGSNNWRHSGLRKWLNADPTTAANAWWAKTTAFDKAPSYANQLPFLALLADSAEEGAECSLLEVIQPVRVQTVLNTIKNPDNNNYYLDASHGLTGRDADDYSATRLAYDITEDKIFLLSTTEVFMGLYQNDGQILDYYKKFSDYASPNSGADKNRIKYRAGAAAHWWLRSPYTGYAVSTRIVFTTGASDYSGASYSYGVAPAFTIY